jgi:hypothetical protein
MDIWCAIFSNKLDVYKGCKEINGTLTAVMKSGFCLI